MIAVVNDISFRYPFASLEIAVEKICLFLNICKRIQKEEITNIKEIKTGVIDMQREISPGCKLIQLVQGIKDREERTFFLGILTNRGTYQTAEGEKCEMGGEESYICMQAVNNFLLSLLSNRSFSKTTVEGISKGKTVLFRNISQDEHIEFYRKELGIRRYFANIKKHKPDRENFYGKGKVGSRMDLSDEEAQVLLNKAIYIKGRLYAKKGTSYYTFPNEGDVNYHGYRIDDIGEDVRRQIDKETW